MNTFFMQVTFGSRVIFGSNIASLIGLIYIFTAVIYLIIMIFWMGRTSFRLYNSALLGYISQTIITSLVMLICGFILSFQGWRLDPSLQFVQFLLATLIIYLIIKDMFINTFYRNR